MARTTNVPVILALLVGLFLALPAHGQPMPKVDVPPAQKKAAIKAFKACKVLHPGECAILTELSKKGAKGADVAITLLAERDPWLQRAGARVLARVADKRAAMPLVPLLSSDDVNVRSAALDALGLCGGPAQSIHVVGLLDHEKELAPRVAAIRALGRMKSSKGLDKLVAALADPQYNVAEAAANALGLLAEPAALLPLATVVNDPSAHEFVRVAAARSLMRMKDSRAIPTFIQACNDPVTDIRRSAILGLGLLNAVGAYELLLDLLADETVLRETVMALGQLDDKRTLAPLLAVLRAEDLDSDIRITVLRSLGRNKVTDAVPELLAMLRGRSSLSVEVIRALGEIGDQRALSRLVEALASKDPTVVGAANTALSALTGQRFDPNPEVWKRWLTDRDLPVTLSPQPSGE